MRVLEKQVCKALEEGRDWHGKNTAVESYEEGAYVFLFGTLIAWYKAGVLYIRKRNYAWAGSRTTGSRVTALCKWAKESDISVVEGAEL